MKFDSAHLNSQIMAGYYYPGKLLHVPSLQQRLHLGEQVCWHQYLEVHQPHEISPQMEEGWLLPLPSDYSLLHPLLGQYSTPLVLLAELGDLAVADVVVQLEHDAAAVVQHLRQTFLMISVLN